MRRFIRFLLHQTVLSKAAFVLLHGHSGVIVLNSPVPSPINARLEGWLSMKIEKFALLVLVVFFLIVIAVSLRKFVH